MDVKGQRVGIVGAAKSGIAAAKVLFHLGATVLLSDIQSQAKLRPLLEAAHLPPGIEIESGGHTEKLLTVDFIVLSPGVPTDIPILQKATAKQIPIFSEIEIAYQLSRGKRLVITGSNGKTTTTTLLAEFCRKKFQKVFLGGNIGFPMIEFAPQTGPDAIQVLEVSSFQLETISTFKPDIGIITNFYANHLDRYPSFDSYRKAKERIAMNMGPADRLILNADQIEENDSFFQGLKCSKAWFGWNLKGRYPGVTVEDGIFKYSDPSGKISELFKTDLIRILGRHNQENIMAASCAALLSGVEAREIAAVVQAFPGVEHRLEWVRDLNGVKYINDSKGTNCAASIIALKACQAPIILLAGGRDKGTDLVCWVEVIKEKAKGVVLMGEAKERFRSALEGIVPLKMGKTFEDGVKLAIDWSAPGDTVLFSPACSSYDMFPNFEVRGKAFKDLILNLPPKPKAQ